MSVAVSIFLLALTRAEIVERMRAPVVTRADGLVKVYADCPADMRREYQTPIAAYAANTVETLYHGEKMKPVDFSSPGIVIHVGDVRTNVAETMVRVVTNDDRVVTRLYVRSPGFVNLNHFRLQLVKAFYRSVKGVELADADAVRRYRNADPVLRIRAERTDLLRWLNGADGDDEMHITMMRKVFEPGVAGRLDLLIFASRLHLYPPCHARPFLGQAHSLSFRDAVKWAKADPLIRYAAAKKASDVALFAAGRSEKMREAGRAYERFLVRLACGESQPEELLAMLDEADAKLNIAYEEARKIEGVKNEGCSKEDDNR